MYQQFLAFLSPDVASHVDIPVMVGSGVTAENLRNYSKANALIVGSHFKQGGRLEFTCFYILDKISYNCNRDIFDTDGTATLTLTNCANLWRLLGHREVDKRNKVFFLSCNTKWKLDMFMSREPGNGIDQSTSGYKNDVIVR